MIVDSHIHIGQFNSQYFTPSDIRKLMSDVGADYYAVSSTTMCEEDYTKVLDELHELICLDGDKVLPVMWITPEGLKGNIAWFLESDIKWRSLKIHPFLHQTEWNPGGELFAEVLDIARELSLPLIIHTGNEPCCKANIYEQSVRENPDITFVMAHGRPIDSALRIAATYDNAYADSAFMPVDDMKKFVDAGLSHKLLWGTDMCIPKHFYPQEDMVEYYLRKLNVFKGICPQEQFEQVTYKNAVKVFNIKQ